MERSFRETKHTTILYLILPATMAFGPLWITFWYLTLAVSMTAQAVPSTLPRIPLISTAPLTTARPEICVPSLRAAIAPLTATPLSFPRGHLQRWHNQDYKFSQNRETFAAKNEHTLTIYYVERGAGVSNCEISFNLPQRDNLSVSKNVPSSGAIRTKKRLLRSLYRHQRRNHQC